MKPQRLITLTVLLAWVFLGPIALAFGSCAGMGAMCEGPCGGTSCLAALAASSPEAAADLEREPMSHPRTLTSNIPEPPPKLLRLPS